MSRATNDQWPIVLFADDSRLERIMVEHILTEAGYRTLLANDGHEAMQQLSRPDAPLLVLLDWMMPGPSGPEIVRWLRAQEGGKRFYVMLLTGMDSASDVVAGFDSGADDFVTKPFRADELIARLRAGSRVLALQRELSEKVEHLEAAMREVNQLRGLIPICMHCHRIRGEGEHWQRLEAYIEEHSGASFSHSLCEQCLEKYYPESDGESASPTENRDEEAA